MLKQVKPLIQSQRRLAHDELKSRLAQLQIDWSDTLSEENNNVHRSHHDNKPARRCDLAW